MKKNKHTKPKNLIPLVKLFSPSSSIPCLTAQVIFTVLCGQITLIRPKTKNSVAKKYSSNITPTTVLIYIIL